MQSTILSTSLGFQAPLGTVRHALRSRSGCTCCYWSERRARVHWRQLRLEGGSLFSGSPVTKTSSHLPQRLSSRTVRASTVEPLVLTEENVNIALDEVKGKLGSMFGNSAENRNVGITGDVYLASLDGPIVVLGLAGRFWHKREDVVSIS